MNYSFEILEGHIVRTLCRLDDGMTSFWDIYLENVFWGGRIQFDMPVDIEHQDRILWMYQLTDEEFKTTGEYAVKGPSTGVICIYTNRNYDKMNFIMFTNKEQMYRRFVHFSHRKESVHIKNDILFLKFQGRIYTDKENDIEINYVNLIIDDNHRIPIALALNDEKYRRVKIQIPLGSIADKETKVNNPIHIEIFIDEDTVSFNLGHKTKKKKVATKYYFLPITASYYKNKAIFVRGNANQNYSLVVRDREEVEYENFFLKKESLRRSFVHYYIGKVKRKFNRKVINLFYEKNSMKAEEGTIEIFKQALKSSVSDNYFILDKRSPQWNEVSSLPNVVEKYSDKYYDLIFRADNFISTETNSHLNVHRSLNHYVRRALLEPRFIFLQHGVTYLKRQGGGSVFVKGKEGEPDYIVVGSDKEADVVSEMLNISKERCIKAGLPIFDTIEYEHINEESEDIVTIMLTWKPYEEHMITHFEDSSYYKNVMAVYRIISDRLPREKIRIVPHPKVLELLKATDVADYVWTESVSLALENTKLLITDYSSVCYNVFYQGGAVIFYQPEKEEYESVVGKLIPKDDEYIGDVFYKLDDLEQKLIDNIINQRIQLKKLRNNQFIERYKSINEFSDGNNVGRIVEFLKEKKII